MKISKRSLGFIISLTILTSQIIGLNTVVLASSNVIPVADSSALLGTVTKVMVTFYGDTTTSKGFTWYTSTASIKSDLQIVEKTSHTANFSKSKSFIGISAVPSNNTATTPPANTTTAKAEFLHKAEEITMKILQ